MRQWGNRNTAHCRWCGNTYDAAKYTGRDGFCSPRCKQAHYRAYNKYVTATQGNVRPRGTGPFLR